MPPSVGIMDLREDSEDGKKNDSSGSRGGKDPKKKQNALEEN